MAGVEGFEPSARGFGDRYTFRVYMLKARIFPSKIKSRQFIKKRFDSNLTVISSIINWIMLFCLYKLYTKSLQRSNALSRLLKTKHQIPHQKPSDIIILN